MSAFDELLRHGPFSLPQYEKDRLLKPALREAFEHHFVACPPYRKFCEKRGVTSLATDFSYADIPYLPVQIFKRMQLSSMENQAAVRVLQSSATTSQTPSVVVLDNLTRTRQMKTLLWLMSERLGKERRPFIILDVDPSKSVPGDITLSARGAAIRGFLNAASSAVYCMRARPDGSLELDRELLQQALKEAGQGAKPVVIFGFTYVMYLHAAQGLASGSDALSLPNATVLHIGGWKKLQDQAVSRDVFNTTISRAFGVPASHIIDAYGFTEQLGIVYLDGEDGVKRCPLVSEILVRDPDTLQPVPDGKPGLLEFITPLPHSYPGIAVILDDVGRILSRDRGPDARHGTAFEILGRARAAEMRGCGDIMSESLAPSP